MFIDTYKRGTWSKVEGPESISIDPPDLEGYDSCTLVEEFGSPGCTLKVYEHKNGLDTLYPYLVILSMACTGAIVLVADEISLWLLIKELSPTVQLGMLSEQHEWLEVQHKMLVEEHQWKAIKNEDRWGAVPCKHKPK